MLCVYNIQSILVSLYSHCMCAMSLFFFGGGGAVSVVDCTDVHTFFFFCSCGAGWGVAGGGASCMSSGTLFLSLLLVSDVLIQN